MSSSQYCFNANQNGLAFPVNNPNQTIVWELADPTDIAVISWGNQTTPQVYLYGQATSVNVPNGNSVIVILNPQSITEVPANETFNPSLSIPSGSSYAGVEIDEPSTLTSSNTSNGIYQFNVDGVTLIQVQSATIPNYVGYGNVTYYITGGYYPINPQLQTSAGYFGIQYTTSIPEENGIICGQLVTGTADQYIFAEPIPVSSLVSPEEQTTQQVNLFAPNFLPGLLTPPPPPPKVTSNKTELVTAGVIGALAVVGVILSKKS